MHGREIQEAQAFCDLVADLVPLSRLDVVPLVHRDDQRAAAFGSQAEQRRILLGDASRGVDDADHDVRLLDRLQRLDDAPFLEVLLDPRPSAHARGVDQHVSVAVPLERDVDRVARRARLVERDQPLLADQAVDERRLADIRPPDDADADRTLRTASADIGRGRLDAREQRAP